MRKSLRQLSESLYVFEDTCNAYVVRRDNAALMIDCGSGAAADNLAEIGVESLEWILHTHHHRDQCWGTRGLVAETGAQVAVPEHERYLFEYAGEHWRTKRIYDNYNDTNTFLAPGEDIAVDAVLEDYEEFNWRDLRFFVLPAQGHTVGSSALLAEIDGRLVAFTGDLLAAGGKLYQLHAMEEGYGEMTGVALTLQSLAALEQRDPRLLLPSHGATIEAASKEIRVLRDRLMAIVRLGSELATAGIAGEDPAPTTRYLPHPRLEQLSEHLLWGGPWTCSNFYVILSGSGEALLIDYGHGLIGNMHIALDQQPFETMRFIVHHLDELADRFGVHSIDAVIATHDHDDHTCGIPYLQRHHGTECWALDEVAKVLERPADWASKPCTYPKPIEVARQPSHGDRIEWRGFELTFHHAPGQTEFHSVVSVPIDGRLVAFTGDNYFLENVESGGQIRRQPVQTTVMRNSFQLAMHRRCVEVMREVSPTMICPGHGEILSCSPDEINVYADYVARKERAFRDIVDDPADQYIDLFWARLRPYVTAVEPDSTVEYTLMLRNNLERPATYAARLLPPAGCRASRELASVELGPGERGELTLKLVVPEGVDLARSLVTAEILIDDRSQGPIAEALLTVTAPH